MPHHRYLAARRSSGTSLYHVSGGSRACVAVICPMKCPAVWGNCQRFSQIVLRTTNLLKFSLVDSQCGSISMSFTATIIAIFRRGCMAPPRMEVFLTPEITAKLSQLRRRWVLLHRGSQRRMACRIAVISFSLICLALSLVVYRSDITCSVGSVCVVCPPKSMYAPIPKSPLASVQRRSRGLEGLIMCMPLHNGRK